MTICEELLESRVFAQGIRPPTVPAGTSRLRLTVSASHTTQELERAAASIGEVARRHGVTGQVALQAAGAPPAPQPAQQTQALRASAR